MERFAVVNGLLSTVDGGWSAWSDWTYCTLTCGANSTKTHTRTCTEPEPSNGGKECKGNDMETESCAWVLCPGNTAYSIVKYCVHIPSKLMTTQTYQTQIQSQNK